jgi:hypothetical protein
MRPPRTDLTPVVWFVLSAATALVVALAIASANGGLSGLLTVGEDFTMRDYVAADLGDIELASGAGHDGQQYYGIARDPFGTGEVPDLLDNPSYRYLHILYPAMSGGLGLFSPDLTLAMMLVLAVIGFGLAGACSLVLNRQLGGHSSIAQLAMVNVGLLLAVRFLLPDALALGLGMLGVVLAVSGRDRPAAAALALAVLTKTTYLVIPLALGLWVWNSDRGRTRWLTVAPAVPAALWTAYVFARFGASTAGNLSVPFTGFVGATGLWGEVSTGEVAMALVAAGLVIVGAVLAVVTSNRLLRWLLLAWVGVGLISSEYVWEFGNNTLRALAPLWSLAAVAAAVYVSSNMSRRNLPV